MCQHATPCDGRVTSHRVVVQSEPAAPNQHAEAPATNASDVAVFGVRAFREARALCVWRSLALTSLETLLDLDAPLAELHPDLGEQPAVVALHRLLPVY